MSDQSEQRIVAYCGYNEQIAIHELNNGRSAKQCKNVNCSFMEYPQPTFRPFVPQDRESLAANADNIKIWNMTRDYLPHPYTLGDAASFIAYNMALDTQVNFAIDVSGRAVGAIGYVPRTDVERVSAEVGYWLGEDYWGRGIATKVVAEFTDHLFRSTELIHLFACVFSVNPASMRVLEKAGFSPAGIFHKAAVKNGSLVDLHYYEKLKSWK